MTYVLKVWADSSRPIELDDLGSPEAQLHHVAEALGGTPRSVKWDREGYLITRVGQPFDIHSLNLRASEYVKERSGAAHQDVAGLKGWVYGDAIFVGDMNRHRFFEHVPAHLAQDFANHFDLVDLRDVPEYQRISSVRGVAQEVSQKQQAPEPRVEHATPAREIAPVREEQDRELVQARLDAVIAQSEAIRLVAEAQAQSQSQGMRYRP